MIWFIPILVILALIDALRMKRVWGKVKNINHWLSYLLCAIGIAGLWIILNGFIIAVPVLYFALKCIALRGIFFDVFLNALVNFLITPRAIDYISVNSNALNERGLVNIPFWWRRAGYTTFLIVFIIFL